MSVPAKRRTKASKRRRASHHALKKTNLFNCPDCGQAIVPHRICPKCGHYKGQEKIKIETLAERKKKQEEKAKEEIKKRQ